MTKEEAKKWGLILLAYGYGDQCDVVVKEKGINTVPLSDVYVVDSGDHGVSEDNYDIMELTSPACPKPFLIKELHWEYEEKSDENFVAEYIKFPKDEIFYFAREFIKAAASAEKAEGDFFKMGRFFSKGDKN
jgi:hypothetical protein